MRGRPVLHPVVDGMKVCSACAQLLPVGSFLERKGGGLYARCKPCEREPRRVASSRYRSADPDRADAASRRSSLHARYRLSPEDYEAMVAGQGGVCAVCRCAPPGERLAVDHDHACCPGARSCGRCVRGILCRWCNLRLNVLENMEWRAQAEDYLERYRNG